MKRILQSKAVALLGLYALVASCSSAMQPALQDISSGAAVTLPAR